MPESLPLVMRLFVGRNDQQPEEEQLPEGRGLAEGLLRRRRRRGGRQAQPEDTFTEVESEEEEADPSVPFERENTAANAFLFPLKGQRHPLQHWPSIWPSYRKSGS